MDNSDKLLITSKCKTPRINGFSLLKPFIVLYSNILHLFNKHIRLRRFGRIDIKTDFISVSHFTSFVKFIYVSKRFPLQHISQMRRVSRYFTPILFLAIRATKPSSFIYAFISRRIICYDLSVTICTFKFSYRIPFLYFLLCKSFPHFNHHSVQLRL